MRLALIRADHGHPTVHTQIRIQKREKAVAVAAAESDCAHDRAGNLDACPGTRNPAQVWIWVFQKRHGIVRAWLVRKVGARQPGGIEMDDEDSSGARAMPTSTALLVFGRAIRSASLRRTSVPDRC